MEGDSLYLKETISNLLDNALKYNKPKTKVAISSMKDDSQAVIQVKDNGIGISQRDQRRVFDRFYRVDKSRSRDRGGSGLGLAIVKRVIEDHGGKVTLESAPDKGSIFSITLPIAEKSE